MGLGGINLWQMLIILLIVVLLFGTKKLRSLGGDLGSAIKSFKNAMQEGNQSEKDTTNIQQTDEQKTEDKDKSPQ